MSGVYILEGSRLARLPEHLDHNLEPHWPVPGQEADRIRQDWKVPERIHVGRPRRYLLPTERIRPIPRSHPRAVAGHDLLCTGAHLIRAESEKYADFQCTCRHDLAEVPQDVAGHE